MAAAVGVLDSTLTPTQLLLILLLLFSISQLPLTYSATADTQRVQSSNNNNQMKQIPNCNDIVNQSHCNTNSKCRWCRSTVLDDMCASKPQAWRLPSQIFTCD